jgi:hypothetical protein
METRGTTATSVLVWDGARVRLLQLRLPIWKPDHLAHISIYGHILRCTLYIMSYTMLPYKSV